METRLSQFLRSGGNGDYQIRHYGETLVATGSFLSIKSQFPNYAALRESFTKKLDAIIKSNTEMLLQSVGEQYDPPLTAKDLPDVSAVRADTLALWEERIEVIWTEWHSHLQRLRPIRESMEQHLLRGFAGLINELRQRGLGIRQYVWRSRDDGKVRSAHAEHDDKVFSWDNPPEDGHPGQAFNCRCFAEPMPRGPSSNVVLAELTVPADGFGNPGAGLARRLAGGLIARTPAGLALYAAFEANGQLQEFTDAASQRRIADAAATLGVDLGTVEGLWAAITYAQAKDAASTGGLTGVPKDGPGAEIFAQGMALYAMADPEALRNVQGFAEALKRVEEVGLKAWREGRLRDRDGTLASGWAEVFPELTEDEKRLGQLPGFTAERIDEFREEYPADVLGLPDNTGGAPDDAPVGNVLSTPIPEEVGQNTVEARPDGAFTTPGGNTIGEHGSKGDGLEYITGKGHTAEQIDDIISNPRPDLSGIIAGRGDYKGQEMILLTGQDGQWVLLSPEGEIVAVSNRNRPLRDEENEPDPIIRPLE